MKVSTWKFWGALAAVAALAGCGSTPPKTGYSSADGVPKSVLWVGNSFFYYNNSMHGHVGNLLSSAKVTGVQQTSATISGSGINWHDVSAHFKPGGVASYSLGADNSVKFNTFDRPFDVVIMMDCSQCPIHPQLQSVFYDYAKRHSETVRSYGAQPVLFASWAYQDKPEMTEQLLAANVVMASLFKPNPIGNTYTAGLAPEVAQHLQRVAWETVQGFKN